MPSITTMLCPYLAPGVVPPGVISFQESPHSDPAAQRIAQKARKKQKYGPVLSACCTVAIGTRSRFHGGPLLAEMCVSMHLMENRWMRGSLRQGQSQSGDQQIMGGRRMRPVGSASPRVLRPVEYRPPGVPSTILRDKVIISACVIATDSRRKLGIPGERPGFRRHDETGMVHLAGGAGLRNQPAGKFSTHWSNAQPETVPTQICPLIVISKKISSIPTGFSRAFGADYPSSSRASFPGGSRPSRHAAAGCRTHPVAGAWSNP